jgi:hypothetical protein
MRKPKYPPFMYRDWPDHSHELIAKVDRTARSMSPSWKPENPKRRWVWRKAFERYHRHLAPYPRLRDGAPWSPQVPLPTPAEVQQWLQEFTAFDVRSPALSWDRSGYAWGPLIHPKRPQQRKTNESEPSVRTVTP